MTSKSTLLSILLVAAMGLATWVTFSPYRPPSPTLASSLAIPDAYMEEVTARLMDKEGNLNMKIVSPKLLHYTEGDTTDLTTPQITLYRESPMPWHISSKHAKATQGIDNVNFRDEVEIRHSPDINAPETIIKTASLMVHPNAKTAETKDVIVMLQPNLTVKSTGMIANLTSGDIKLLSQPRGEYVPNS